MCLLYLNHKHVIICKLLTKMVLSIALGDPCPQPTQLNASMLHPCTNATKLNYFDGSKAGFGISVIVLFLFPVGQYNIQKAMSLRSKKHISSIVVKLTISGDFITFTVSLLVAWMVAYFRKYRYRKFQRARQVGDRTDQPSVGITGMKSEGINNIISVSQALQLTQCQLFINIT